ncbi:TPA: hypothetical protein ACJTCA_004151 [Yersinia enterocolitica]|uniref:hypothetical protein n=1 Tax=Yersinia enterocolitica TaxID=630 RepID=UPI0028575400|nr:hypothetical protein [Yersinia enterocolitica]HDL7909458.1 hypothetical protein [Yersinia enterocolitica]HDL7947578.1 hypothetical protein [Yersinia enterocolitica]HDV7148641.1 hypothetical protein [Yersinia enterocolitica]HDV7167293.1 hypothetical protein [Yersinia enterocolitica]
MKKCNKCNISKSSDEFHNRTYKNGTISLQPTCKECKKEIGKQRYNKKKEHILAVSKKWRNENSEQMNSLRQNFKDKNGWYGAYGRATHRANKLNAIPAWADREKIKEVYFNRPDYMVVDHIIPLNSKLVCGLHVHYNLQYLTPEDNSKKGNRF